MDIILVDDLIQFLKNELRGCDEDSERAIEIGNLLQRLEIEMNK